MAAYTAIDDPELYFQVKIYTGDTSSSRSITLDGEEDMQPDLVWCKQRVNTYNHWIYDAVRTAGAEKELVTNLTGAEGAVDNASYGFLGSFNSNGFTASTGSSNNDYLNKNTKTFVAWCWKANGSGSSNSDGDGDNVVVSANTTAGFSIVQGDMNASGSWTFGHGLGVAPSAVILRGQNVTSNWYVYHKDLGAGYRLFLNDTSASTSDATFMNNTSPTSDVFSLNAGTWSAGAGEKMIAYCFVEKQGFSKFGSYTANQDDEDGPFVYLGFRAARVMIKRTSTSGKPWPIMDNKRLGYNVDNNVLNADANSAEHTNDYIDICANGFKIRDDNQDVNNPAGGTYVYMAFAEAPFVNSNGVPCNAR